MLMTDRTMKLSQRELARMIDHTLLKPEATSAQIRDLCTEARSHHFATVCINPSYVSLAAAQLAHSRVGVCAVVGFPLGANHPEVKRAEAHRAILDGASELDMVVAIGRLKAGDFTYVREDIAAVVQAAQGRLVKVILETVLLEPQELELGCRIAKEAGAGFVKTSTGFGPGGATVEAVALMQRVVGEGMGVKASGGIRDVATAQRLIEAGASRLGTSASLALLAAWEEPL
jgi:deoxyribose-phosphate aldolase